MNSGSGRKGLVTLFAGHSYEKYPLGWLEKLFGLVFDCFVLIF